MFSRNVLNFLAQRQWPCRKSFQVQSKLWKCTHRATHLKGELIRQHGYPVEAHELTTEDGYILTYYRIPHGKGHTNTNGDRKPVLLQHGLLGSSADWVLSPNSLGYLLADIGYDVWLGNCRGNVHSRKHKSLNPDDDKEKFWDFSWHEMGYYDLPTAIDYILKESNHDQLFYTGYSMGTTIFLVLGDTRPEYMDKVQAAVLMAPVCSLWNIPTPVIDDAIKVHLILHAIKSATKSHELFPDIKSFMWFKSNFCDAWTLKKYKIFEGLTNLTGSFDEGLERVPESTIQKFSPAGTSYKTIDHFYQIIGSDFQNYDYGPKINEKIYESEVPFKYDVSEVTASVYIHFAANDHFSVPEDVKDLAERLPNVSKVREVPEPLFNHTDFIWATEAKGLVYADIIDTFIKLSPTEHSGKTKDKCCFK